MTAAPEPGAQDLAEKAARAWHEHVAHVPWEQMTGKDRLIALAERRLRAFRAAGLAVVELPATVLREQRVNSIGLEIEVPTPGERSWEVTGLHFPGYDDDRVGIGQQGWRSLDDARRDAARILAACDAVDRLRAYEDDKPLGHDGTGPPICEPCSADCPACSAEPCGARVLVRRLVRYGRRAVRGGPAMNPCPACAARTDGAACFQCWLRLPLDQKAAKRPPRHNPSKRRAA